jgi:hypothetical protein
MSRITRPGSRPDIPREDPVDEAPRRLSPWEIEIRDVRARIGSAEERIDALEDWTEGSKIKNLQKEEKARVWSRSIMRIGETLITAVLLLALAYALSRVSCTSTPHPLPKVETVP